MTSELTYHSTLNHQQSEREEQFQWTKQWYPVATANFLDPDKPHAIQLLGKELVLWRDYNHHWHCWENLCPHRGAPLSEGRIEADGNLLCAYHGWRFNGEGKCVKIPQSFDTETEAHNCNHPQACPTVYPTQIAQGLIWVWGESGEQAFEECQLKSPRLIPELEQDSDRVVQTPWTVRDLPYGWDFFMENVSDPAHVPVSHHGLQGNRYTDPEYYDMIPIRKPSTEQGFSFSVTPVKGNLTEIIHDFQPPCHMRIASTNQDGGQLILALYAIPTYPGWCRNIGCQVFVKDQNGKLPKGFSLFGTSLPAWLTHVLASLFLHQDLVFLHYQEKLLAQQSPKNYLNKYYTPNPQDKMVITFRQWLLKRAGGEIPWFGNDNLPEPERDKEKLFDVWNTHTKHCRVCQNALKNIRFAFQLSYFLAGICFLLGIIIDARVSAYSIVNNTESWLISPPWIFLGLLLTGTLLGLAGYYLQKFSKLFYVYQFEHSNND